MDQIYKKARAKINLNLLVLNKRDDGYHDIKSVFQKINLYDEMFITKIPGNNIILKTDAEEINNNQNIICKAYRKLKEKYDQISGIEVVLKKNIPMQAGLAGGSTDCATFIVCMNKLFDLNMKKTEMESIGSSLGADVVPCFYNVPILVEGIGNIITKFDSNFKYYIIIIKPKLFHETKEMYQKLDKKSNEINQIDNTNEILEALKSKNIKKLSNSLYNVFENAVEEIDVINELKNILRDTGAINSLMTGSGSCVFGIYENKEQAKEAYNKLKNDYQTFICTSCSFKKEEMF